MSAAGIIITSHNYGAFLPAAIDSALAQSQPAEVVVVDDGSTDGSRDIIAGYGRRVRAIFKPAGGQASAFNAGFAVCPGDPVIFLDADDLLLPDAVSTAAEALRHTGAAKVHWPLEVIDEIGGAIGKRHPVSPLPEGDFRQRLATEGPWMCEAPPTSGNAFRRDTVVRALPMPEDEFRICADAWLLTAAAADGPIARIDRPLSCYRVHARNNYWNRPFEQQMSQSMAMYDLQCRAAGRMLEERGIAHDRSGWPAYSWWHRLGRGVDLITSIVPAGQAFFLADEDQWGTPEMVRGRRRRPFPQVDDRFSGPPASDAAAVAALEEVPEVAWFALAWTARWYLDSFPSLAARLNAGGELASNDAVQLFSLR